MLEVSPGEIIMNDNNEIEKKEKDCILHMIHPQERIPPSRTKGEYQTCVSCPLPHLSCIIFGQRLLVEDPAPGRTKTQTIFQFLFPTIIRTPHPKSHDGKRDWGKDPHDDHAATDWRSDNKDWGFLFFYGLDCGMGWAKPPK